MTSTATAAIPLQRTAAAGGAAGGSGPGGPPPHRVVGFARRLHAVLDSIGDPSAWAMTETEQAETLTLLHSASSRLAGLRLRVLAAADANDLGRNQGGASTPAWLAHATVRTPASCHRDLRLAQALESDFTATGAALAAGACDPEQAWVIITAVRRLVCDHDHLPEGTHAKAEAHLLALAKEFDATTLRALGKRLFEVVCPEAADQAEGQRLEDEEAQARRKAFLSMRETGEGTVEGRFRFPVLHAQLLKKILEELTSPDRLGEARLDPATGDPLPASTLAGRGFMELLEHHLDFHTLPKNRKSPFRLVVTIGLDALLSGIGAATLETGGRISAAEARRLACRAGILPLVLGGDSEPLDLGREQRCFTWPQHLVATVQYGGCATHGCDRPPGHTQMHHPHAWANGGRTDQANGLPLCPPHHHMADHPDQWDLHTLPSGKVRFSRRRE